MLNFTAHNPLDLEGFRLLADRNLFKTSDEPRGDFLINPEFRDWVIARAVKPAAVLIPIVEREAGLSVILTKRTEKLSTHSGQIAFAGGKIDADDNGPEGAALREAHEEIGLAPHDVDVLGVMEEYLTGSGFRVSPVVGFVPSTASLVANEDEVEYIFEVPLSFLLDVNNHKMGSRVFEGKRRYFFEIPYENHYIWGVTAGIIRQFQEKLTNADK